MSWLTVLIPLAYLWLFWGVYVLVMGLYRAYLANRLGPVSRVLGAPFFIVGYLLDVFTQMTFATLVFLELPSEVLVTTRLTRYLRAGTGWRFRVAAWICRNLLDPFEPTRNHCH